MLQIPPDALDNKRVQLEAQLQIESQVQNEAKLRQKCRKGSKPKRDWKRWTLRQAQSELKAQAKAADVDHLLNWADAIGVVKEYGRGGACLLVKS